jgi:NitT/TauT family transport system ATP-binding protein
MKPVVLRATYVPLVDAAPLIVAEAMGFAAAEGLQLDLVAAPSWSAARDMLILGQVDAAHLLSPIPVAAALGLGGVRAELAAVSVLSVNGDVIGVSRRIEERLRADGFAFELNDALATARALARAAPGGRLRMGVPFPFSMHRILLDLWARATPLADIAFDIRTVPPPLMRRALADDEIDAFCVGEPWGSVAVESGVGALVLAGRAIWAFAPEKVLAMRRDRAEDPSGNTGALMRAIWAAGRWLSRPDSRDAAAELMAGRALTDVPAELIERALSGQLTILQTGQQRHVPSFVEFHAGLATFPWRSQARFIADRLATLHGLDRAGARDAGARVFRTDLYRRHLGPMGIDLPGASEKVEGAITHPTPVASLRGGITLLPDRFFDGRIFDPALPVS